MNRVSSTPLVLTIDPGISLGIAIWDRKLWPECVMPEEAFILKVAKKEKGPRDSITYWEMQMLDTVALLKDTIGTSVITEVYIELPEFMDRTVRGDTTAKTGSLVKLSIMVGAIAFMFWERDPKTRVILIPVHEWKGQLPKNIVVNRIKKLLPNVKEQINPTHDAWDAIGLGLYVKGYFE